MKIEEFNKAKALQKKIEIADAAIKDLKGEVCILLGSNRRMDEDLDIHEQLKQTMLNRLYTIKEAATKEFQKL